MAAADLVINKKVNPWSVESIYEFSYFWCPECDNKWRAKQEFVNHAFHSHPQSIDSLQCIKDGSVDDVNFPDDGTEIKTEEEQQHHKSDFNKVVDPAELLSKCEVKAEEETFNEDDIIHDDDDDDDNEDHDDKGAAAAAADDLKRIVCKEYFFNRHALMNHGCATVVSPCDFEDIPLKRLKQKIERNFTCDMCDFSAKNPKFLLAHVKNIHKSSKVVNCTECHETFKSVQQLRHHMFKMHKASSKRQEKCLCTLCGKTLIGRSNLKKHEREKHGVDNAKFIRKDKIVKIQCSKCNDNFETPTELNEHVTACFGESKKFACTHCASKWASGPVLNIHLKIDHKMPEIHTCDRCGKCLKKKVSLLSHIKVDHDNIKDHVCHLCGRGFARQQGLQFHIKRVHENTGKHFCDRCPFKAITRPELEIHINEVHTKAIKFQCDQCNFFCFRKGGLAAHVKNVHLKLRPHRCESCGQAFVRRKELEKHKEWANHD